MDSFDTEVVAAVGSFVNDGSEEKSVGCIGADRTADEIAAQIQKLSGDIVTVLGGLDTEKYGGDSGIGPKSYPGALFAVLRKVSIDNAGRHPCDEHTTAHMTRFTCETVVGRE